MKVILTGSTGFIGSAVLQRCIAHPSITSIVALTRRELPITNPKLQTVILKDFLTYDATTLHHLEGAEACIWALGTPTAGREVHFDYTLAAVHAFFSALTPALGEKGQRFRHIQLSGAFTEKDQDRSLWFLGATRKMRGDVETALVDFERSHAELWKLSILRPAAVGKDGSVARFVMPGLWIGVEELAAAVVDVAVRGDGEVFVENGELRERGQAALRALP